MPIPPENATNKVAALTGIDPEVFTHNHSPGFEILPNGDALAVYFSTPPGEAEAATTTTFVQARLRYGAEEWDLPELFVDFKNINDQSGLLWKDGNKIWFFGGGRDFSDSVPFKIATSTDNGVTLEIVLAATRSCAGALHPAANHERISRGGRVDLFCDGRRRSEQLPVAQCRRGRSLDTDGRPNRRTAFGDCAVR